MDCLCDYQESILELKHKLLCTSFELESARAEAKEDIRRNHETTKQLLSLLQIICQERDDARDQLRKLLLIINTNSSSNFSNTGLIHSRDFGVENQQIVQEHTGPVIDPDLAVIDALVKGRDLPQKGKLLEAVIEAGPILDDTLLVAGPLLPQWHNPPPTPTQSFLVFPEVHFGLPDPETGANDSNFRIRNSLCSSSFHNISHGSPKKNTPLASNLGRVSGLTLKKEHSISSVKR